MKADDLGLEMQVSVFAVRAYPAPEQMNRRTNG